jgi:protein OS-9
LQYEVVFSDSYISELDARSLLNRPPYSSSSEPEARDSTDIESQNGGSPPAEGGTNTKQETYETMWLHDQEYLCSIPIVESAPRNVTSEAEALAEEKRELARATDRGWELLQDLGGGNCLYFISGWWSYQFCYGQEITQFHAQPGKVGLPPQPDTNYPKYVLGRVKSHTKDKDDDKERGVDVHNGQKHKNPPTTELQVKGDTRYLVQKMEGGTTCDLTGKPRRIEVQFHCNLNPVDVIGWIKEVTTCSYLMVVYTPRLCNDVAFLPPKESKANIIACQQVVPDNEISYWKELKTLEAESNMRGEEAKAEPVVVGGVVLGGGKYFGKGGPKLQLPANWQVGAQAPGAQHDVIARSKGKVENNKVEILSDEALQKLDLDPKVVEQLKSELQKMAGDRGWKIEIVDLPGEEREIRGSMDGDEEEEGEEKKDGNGNEGSEETYVEEL